MRFVLSAVIVWGVARQLKEVVLKPSRGLHIIVAWGASSPWKAASTDAHENGCAPVCASLTTGNDASTNGCDGKREGAEVVPGGLRHR